MTIANKSSVIRNVQFYYAKLDKPVVNKFGKEQYDIQLRFPQDRIVEMSAFGKPRLEKDGNYAINITRNPKNSKGQDTKVRVVDANKNPITDLIGNGSSGNVIVYSYPYNVGGREGIKTVLIAVQVTNFIKYIPESDVDFDIIEPMNKQEPVSADF